MVNVMRIFLASVLLFMLMSALFIIITDVKHQLFGLILFSSVGVLLVIILDAWQKQPNPKH
jgi:hypothetical protein